MINYLKSIISQSSTNLISYSDYIDAVLYHPEKGYYMKKKPKIGKRGDFITTSNISDIYGRIMAKWFALVCQKNNLEPIFCEIGAGNGRFAKAFLEEWNYSIKAPVKYIIVESSRYHRELQEEILGEYSTAVVRVDRLDRLDCFDGMIFSNELFDALPVDVIEKTNGELYEVMVGIKDDHLYEEKILLTNPAILFFLQKHNLHLNEGQRIEVPLLMENLLMEMSKTLKSGLVVTADYGYSKQDWMEPSRRMGSLRGYYQHKMIENVLEHPGEMDITSHIHFDWLIQKGKELGLDELMKLRQDEFLIKIGILDELENHFDSNPFSEVSKRNRAIRSLIMPSGLSSFFHIVIQQKGHKWDGRNIFEN